MENFVLYEEIGKFGEITMHKGRRKGTIMYLAICCVDKACRAKITNHVRFVHEFQHEKIVRFFEWYETCNHLWLVMELCTGGTLHQVIEEDKHLPESIIRKFAGDMVGGLHYMHSMGVLYSDWRPMNILLDGQGTMKFFDFTLTRKVDENLMELFEQFGEDTSSHNSFGAGKRKATGSEGKLEPALNYLAPEILQGKNYSMASDLWGLGCVLYEMYCGQQAFSAQNERQLVDKILHRDPPPLKAKGTRVSGKPSPHFQDLVFALLCKNPQERLSWKALISHPFWQNELEQFLREDAAHSSASAASARTGAQSKRGGAENDAGGSSRSRLATPSNKPDPEAELDKSNTSSWGMNHPPRPATASGMRGPDSTAQDPHSAEDEVSFTMHLSSRHHTNATLLDQAKNSPPAPPTADEEQPQRSREHPAALQNQQLTSESATIFVPDSASRLQGESLLRLLRGLLESPGSSAAPRPSAGGNRRSSLQPHLPQPLVDYMKLLRTQSATSFDPKSLSVPPYTLQKLKTLEQREVQKHLSQVFASFSQLERGPPSQKRLHLLNYLLSLTPHPDCAALLYSTGFVREACRQLKENAQQHTPPFMDSRIRLTRLIASTVYHSGESSHPVLNVAQLQAELSECLLLLSDLLRDQFRVAKTKEALLLAVGEIVCRLSRGSSSLTSIPSMTVTQIVRCLHRNEESAISIMACRIIENVCFAASESGLNFSVTSSTHNAGSTTASTSSWLNNELASQLWAMYKYSNVDALRLAASSALCAICLLQSSCFIHVADKVGLNSILEQLQPGTQQKIQENFLGMLAVMLLRHASSSSCKKLSQEKKFVSALLALLESPSAFTRGYVFFMLALILPTYPEALQQACGQRLVSFMDRDSRWLQQATPSTTAPTEESPARRALAGSLARLHELLTEFLPSAWREILHSLEAVQRRQHPSTIQARRLKQWVPLLACVLDLVNYGPMRDQILLSAAFVDFLSDLLKQCVPLLRGETNLEPALGARANQEVCGLALCLLEAATQHKQVVTKHVELVLNRLLPPLLELVASTPSPPSGSQSGGPSGPTGDGQWRVSETQMIALKIFSDIVESSFFKDNEKPASAGSETQQKAREELSRLIDEWVVPQADPFLQSMEPASSHILHLLNLYLERSPMSAQSSLYRLHFHHSLLHHLLQQVTAASSGPGGGPSDTTMLSHGFQSCLRLLASLLNVARERLTNPATPVAGGMEKALSKMVPEMVHELELVPILLVVAFHVSDMCLHPQESSVLAESNHLIGCLLQSLESVNALLKYVSDVVRQALQLRRSGGAGGGSARSGAGGGLDTMALQAEQLLLACRSLTELLPVLCQLLCHEDSDVSESALRAVSHLASLYGADQSGGDDGTSHALTDANLYWLAAALGKADTKRARLLLRILKRFIVTFTARGTPLPSNLPHLATLEGALTALNRSALAQGDNTLKQLSQELLQFITRKS